MAQQQRTANRLTAEALDIREENPTLALQLAHYACELVGNDNELALRTRDEIFRVNVGSFCRRSYRCANSTIDALQISPDGQKILIATARIRAGEPDIGSVEAWSLAGDNHSMIIGPVDDFSAVAFSRDGQYILTGSRTGEIALWSINGDKLWQKIAYNDRIRSVAFTGNGRYLFIDGLSVAKLLDLNGELLQTFSNDDGWLEGMAIAPDGKELLIHEGADPLMLVDWNGKIIREYYGHEGEILTAGFSLDGTHLASGDNYGKMIYWKRDGSSRKVFSGHTGSVNTVAFSPSADYILTGSDDGTARVWDTSGQVVQVLKRHVGNQELGPAAYLNSISTVAFSLDGQTILTGSPGTVKRWTFSPSNKRKYDQSSKSALAMAFWYDKPLLLSGGYRDTTAILWNEKGDPIRKLEGHEGFVWTGAISPDRQQVITGSSDHTARVWTVNGQTLQILKGHTELVSAVAFSPNDSKILTGSRDSTLRLWDKSGQLLKVIPSKNGIIRKATFSPDGQFILANTLSSKGNIALWNLQGELITSFEAKGNNAVFSPDQQLISTADRGSVQFWSTNGRLLKEIQLPIPYIKKKGRLPKISDLAFSPDGKFLLVGTSEIGASAAYLFDTTGRLMQTVDYDANLVAFPPQPEKLLLVNGADAYVFAPNMLHLLDDGYLEPLSDVQSITVRFSRSAFALIRR